MHNNIVKTIRRRKGIIYLSFLFILLPTLFLSVILKSTYLSEAKIIINNVQIPKKVPQSLLKSYFKSQLNSETVHILSRDKLSAIINNNYLYLGLRERFEYLEVISKMRDDINISIINIGYDDHSSSATVTFSISYEGSEPFSSRQTTEDLVGAFKEENVLIVDRMKSSGSTTVYFLQQELDNVKKSKDDIENKINEFKKTYGLKNPCYKRVNERDLDRLKVAFDRINKKLLDQKGSRSRLKQQILKIDPHLRSEKKQTSTEKQLARLNLELTELQSNYSNKYPDIVQLKNEIREVKKQFTLDRLTNKENDSDSRRKNPKYNTLKSKIDLMNIKIEMLLKEKKVIESKTYNLKKKIDKSFSIDSSYTDLISKQDSLTKRYQTIFSDLSKTKLAQGLKVAKQVDRFSLLETPNLPNRPFRPNRPTIILKGVLSFILFSLFFVGMVETLDDSVKTSDQLRMITGVPLLSILSLQENEKEKRLLLLKYYLMIFGMFVAFAVLYCIHYYIIPMDNLL